MKNRKTKGKENENNVKNKQLTNTDWNLKILHQNNKNKKRKCYRKIQRKTDKKNKYTKRKRKVNVIKFYSKYIWFVFSIDRISAFIIFIFFFSAFVFNLKVSKTSVQQHERMQNQSTLTQIRYKPNNKKRPASLYLSFTFSLFP